MWELELWEGTGPDRERLGVLRLREVQRDPISGTIGVAVEGDRGQALATVQVLEADARPRPWKAALLALDKLYGGLRVPPVLKADGQCNGLTKTKGKRCQMGAMPGGFYCQNHDPLREAKR